jgi:hypothetical protein
MGGQGSTPPPDPPDVEVGGALAPAFGTPTDLPSPPPSTQDAVSTVNSSPAAIIAVIDDAIARGGDVASYIVNGRTVVLRSLTELINARRYYQGELARSRGLRRTRAFFP